MNTITDKAKSVEFFNVEKIYQSKTNKAVKAVDNISLKIDSGDFVTLLGPSGCGKTTMLRMVAGFETPTSGQIHIGKEEVTSLMPNKRDTAMVFQNYALFPHLNVFENISYGLHIRKLKQRDIEVKVENIIEMVGLTGLEKRNPNQLSGGQQQRVALARSLVVEPSVLLFDEPLSNLDAKLRMYMRNEIRKIQQKVGITSIFVTHDQAEAMSMADKIIVMNNGRIEQIGTPSEVYNTPASRFVADFIGLANILEAKVVGFSPQVATVECLGARFAINTDKTVNIGDQVKIVVRPETMSLCSTGTIGVKVDISIFMGAYQDYQVLSGETRLFIVEYNPSQKKIFHQGQEAYLALDEKSMHLII